MTAEPSASIWEVTRLILENPDRSPADIAHDHGYSPAEIAEHLPIFLDTARTDWAAHAPGDWAVPIGGDAADLDPELYLRDLAGSGSIDVAGFDAPVEYADLGPDAGGDLDVDVPAEAWTAGDAGPLAPDPGELIDGPDPVVDGSGEDPGDALDVVDGAPAVDVDDDSLDDASPNPHGHQLPLGEDDPFGSDPFDGDPYDSGPFTDDPFGDPPGLEAPDPAADVDDALDDPYPG